MSERQLIFSVEDEENIRELVECAVSASGFSVETFPTAEEMLKRIQTVRPDLILMDIMLPGLDGIETMRQVKGRFPTLPVILVTAKGSEPNKVKGLDSGADDYVTKPFGVLELISRIRARLRKNVLEELSINGVVLNDLKHTVTAQGAPVELTAKEYLLLRYLMHNAGNVVPRDTLLNEVWGFDSMTETRTLDMHVMSLRSKLADESDSSGYRYINTVRGVGYSFRENCEAKNLK